MSAYICPEHGTQQFQVLNWNNRGTTYHDGSFDLTSVFELTCGCQVHQEDYHDGDVQRYRVIARDDVTVVSE